jgi:hypothetical protein
MDAGKVPTYEASLSLERNEAFDGYCKLWCNKACFNILHRGPAYALRSVECLCLRQKNSLGGDPSYFQLMKRFLKSP